MNKEDNISSNDTYIPKHAHREYLDNIKKEIDISSEIDNDNDFWDNDKKYSSIIKNYNKINEDINKEDINKEENINKISILSCCDNICGSVFYKPETDNKKNGNAL